MATQKERLEACIQLIGETIKELRDRAQNFEVTAHADGASFTHSMDSTKLCVSFYNAAGIEQYDIRWAPNGVNAIYVYLPVLETGTNTFTGDIFIQKR